MSQNWAEDVCGQRAAAVDPARFPIAIWIGTSNLTLIGQLPVRLASTYMTTIKVIKDADLQPHQTEIKAETVLREPMTPGRAAFDPAFPNSA